MSDKKNVIEIIANAIILMIVGSKNNIDILVSELNEKNNIYFAHPINVPIIMKCKEFSVEMKNDINLSIYTEIAHAYTYSVVDENCYCIFNIENYNINIPYVELDESGEPEKSIYSWLKFNVKTLPKGLKKLLKPITLVGANKELLVYAYLLD